jgi:hypothetical protein
MKKLAFAILFLLVSFSSSYPADPPTKLALLFAVPQSSCPEDFECGHGQGAFETFLLVIDGDQMKVAVRTPHLYVPRKSGFWEIGILPPKNLGGEQNGGDGSSNCMTGSCGLRLWERSPSFHLLTTAILIRAVAIVV